MRTLRRALHAIGGNTQNRGLLEGWWWSLPGAPTDDRGMAHFAAGTVDAMVAEQNVPAPLANDNIPSAPQNPVPLCPLPENSNAPPPPHPSPIAPTATKSIVALEQLRRQTGCFHRAELAEVNDPFPQASPHHPRNPTKKPNPRPTKTGNPILDALLDSLRKPLPTNSQNSPQPTPNTS